MARMKAILVEGRNGGIESLVVGETDRPEPSHQDVLVKVKAFGLNRMDIAQRKGLRSVNQQRILGVEFSGLIAEVGPNVSKWRINDEVFGLASGGAYAEYVVVPETHIIKKPESLSWVEAAAIPENWLTAFQALVKIANIKEGEDVLVHAGASGVGLAAIQVARLYGTKNVFTTSSKREKLDFVLNLPDGGLSATHAVNYKTEDFSGAVAEATGGKGVDILIDFVGQSHWHKNIASLAVDGRMVMLAILSGSQVANVDLAPILFKRLRVEGSTLSSRSVAYKTELIADFQEKIFGHIVDGRLKIYIHKVYPWTKIREAHREMEENKNIGKIVMEID